MAAADIIIRPRIPKNGESLPALGKIDIEGM
jgi:hypothetical protein